MVRLELFWAKFVWGNVVPAMMLRKFTRGKKCSTSVCLFVPKYWAKLNRRKHVRSFLVVFTHDNYKYSQRVKVDIFFWCWQVSGKAKKFSRLSLLSLFIFSFRKNFYLKPLYTIERFFTGLGIKFPPFYFILCFLSFSSCHLVGHR